MADNLIIFAKAPEPGRVKTRLCELITCEEAVDLYDAFLSDTIETALSAGDYRMTLEYAPAEAGGWFMERFDGLGLEFAPQEGHDLGARMHRAFDRAFATGSGRAVLIGADIPTMTADDISTAFDRLTEADLVFGPSEDGGYWLVGMDRPAPGIFEGVAWSTPGVLAETLRRAEALGLSVSLLARQRDVDTPDDLAALAGAKLPPRTRAVVDRLASKFSRS